MHGSIKPERSSGYMPQLDALRAIAVLAVMLSHFVSPARGIHFAHWGRLGVLLFFVLSGFLITRILLAARDSENPWRTLGVFYIRRGLRLWPAYFLLLAVLAAIGLPAVRDGWIWLVTYTTNFAIGFEGVRFGRATHLWSLAAEEQFYLLWPLVVLFTPTRLVAPASATVLLASLGYKIIAAGVYGFGWTAIAFPIMGVADALAIGALMACWHGSPRAMAWYVRASVWIGWPALVALQAVYWLHDNARGFLPYLAFGDLAAALAFVSLVYAAARGVGGPAGALLNLRPLLYVGKISYGVYLYHNFVPIFARDLWNMIGLAPLNVYLWFAWCAGLSVLIAALSWHLVELPINRYKHLFPYRQPSMMPALTAPARASRP